MDNSMTDELQQEEDRLDHSYYLTILVIRVFILLSLFIQIILIFLGCLRRAFSSRWVRMVVWGSYLLAEWVATYILAYLTSILNISSSDVVIAFWAPFFILHHSGPDTITAYSMEDNELWARHILELGIDLYIVYRVFYYSLINTNLLAPTILILLVAIIKYVERSYSLYKASFKGFYNSISSFDRTLPTKDFNALSQAFWMHSATKPAFIDVIPYFDGYNEIRDFLKNMTPGEILKVMKMELNYAYDEFYTKAVINHSRVGYVLRVFCSSCILLAFLLFILAPKDDFNSVDVAITYALLIGAICLDIMASIMLVFSDWMIVTLLNVKKLSDWSSLLVERLVKIKNACHKRSYWSIKMPQLNLLTNCLKISGPNKASRDGMLNWVRRKLNQVEDRKIYMTWKTGDLQTYTLRTLQPVHATQEILEIITFFLKRRLDLSREEFIKPAGFSALQRITNIVDWAIPRFVQLFEGLSLDQQVFVWHIATELCFHCNTYSQHPLHPNQMEIEIEASVSEEVLKRKSLEMEACKYMSNYMMHTVVMRPNMMSTMGGTSSVLICNAIDDMIQFIQLQIPNANVEEVCMKIISTPIDWAHNKSLFEISRVLAHLMLVVWEEERWQVMATAWVDLLMKGAKISRANVHVKQLSKGDELLTFIWLFNKHIEIYDVFLPIHDVLVDRLEKAKHLLSEIELHL